MILFSMIESTTHPDFSALYRQLKISETRFTSSRKIMMHLKKQAPDFIVAEFFYGYSNNYAGVNISNLDVLFYSLQKYAPETKVIIITHKDERQFVAKLESIFPIYAILQHQVSTQDMQQVLGVNKNESF